MLHEVDNLGNRTLAKALGSTYRDNATQVDATRNDLIVHIHVPRHTLSCQCYRVERRLTCNDDTIQRYLLSRFHHNRLTYADLLRMHINNFCTSSHMRHIRTDVHQVTDALTTLALGITLKEFAHLEEEHHKHCLRELCFCPRQETDAQGADGGHRHQEMLVERLAVGNSLGSFHQGVVSYY